MVLVPRFVGEAAAGGEEVHAEVVDGYLGDH
jgi:hypothetical protein